MRFVVDVCAEFFHIMWITQHCRIKKSSHFEKGMCILWYTIIYGLVDYTCKCTFLIPMHLLLLSIKLFINARTWIPLRMYRHLNEDRTYLLALIVVGKILVPQRNQNLRKRVITYLQTERAASLATFLAKNWPVIELRENTCNSVVIPYTHSA